MDASAAIAVALGQLDEDVYLTDELASPHLVDCEVLNGLRNRLLGGRLNEQQAADAVIIFEDLVIERFPVDWLRPRMWELRHNLTAYAAAYVALAEAVDADELLTADAKLQGAPGVRCAVTVVNR